MLRNMKKCSMNKSSKLTIKNGTMNKYLKLLMALFQLNKLRIKY